MGRDTFAVVADVSPLASPETTRRLKTQLSNSVFVRKCAIALKIVDSLQWLASAKPVLASRVPLDGHIQRPRQLAVVVSNFVPRFLEFGIDRFASLFVCLSGFKEKCFLYNFVRLHKSLRITPHFL